MRADAARNLDAILRAGARRLSQDPSATITDIAAEAGVSRRLVYTRFASREALREAVLHAKLDAIEAVLVDARLDTAPVAVALHRLVEGVIAVIRRYPLELDLPRGVATSSVEPEVKSGAESYARMRDQRARIAEFLRRATGDGLIRSDLPDGLVQAHLDQVIELLARQLPDHDPGQAADIAVNSMLTGMGQG